MLLSMTSSKATTTFSPSIYTASMQGKYAGQGSTLAYAEKRHVLDSCKCRTQACNGQRQEQGRCMCRTYACAGQRHARALQDTGVCRTDACAGHMHGQDRGMCMTKALEALRAGACRTGSQQQHVASIMQNCIALSLGYSRRLPNRADVCQLHIVKEKTCWASTGCIIEAAVHDNMC
jgi:hypothetical protein